MFKRLVKNTTIVSAGTLCSRILGLVRDIFIAKYFGTSKILEAFIVAFRLPNILRSLFAEGFSDAVATPVLSEYHKDRVQLSRVGGRLFSVFLVLMGVVTALGIILTRWLVLGIAPGFLKDPQQLELAMTFTKITFFYLFFIGLVAVINSILYALKKFAFPSFLPMLFNISLICGIIFFKQYFHNYILVISVLAAGFLQFIFAFLYLGRSGVRFKINFVQSFRDSEIVRMAKLFVPRVWSSIVYHLNVFIDTIFSSLSWIVGEGALAAVYYANRIVQLPLALIGISISQVAIVDLSGFHKDNNMKDFKELLMFSLQNILFFIIPIMCVLLFMSGELLDILFYRGDFDAHSLHITSSTLFFYSLGIFFFCGIKLLVNAFYALKDTFTPAKTSAFALILNAALSATLMFPLKIGGVALASSIAAMVNYFLLYKLLIRRIGPINWDGIRGDILKLIILGGLAGLLLKVIWLVLPYNKYIKLFVGVVLSGSVFLVVGNILKLERVIYFNRWILRKL